MGLVVRRCRSTSPYGRTGIDLAQVAAQQEYPPADGEHREDPPLDRIGKVRADADLGRLRRAWRLCRRRPLLAEVDRGAEHRVGEHASDGPDVEARDRPLRRGGHRRRAGSLRRAYGADDGDLARRRRRNVDGRLGPSRATDESSVDEQRRPVGGDERHHDAHACPALERAVADENGVRGVVAADRGDRPPARRAVGRRGRERAGP
jgi:hypothetical protein